MRLAGIKLSLATAFLLSFGISPFSFAQNQIQKKEITRDALGAETLKIDTSLVLVDAAVVSKRTNGMVGDLKREDFQLYEDGRPQEITHFSKEELPLSVVLLLDVSSSVFPVIEKIRDSAQDALAKLKPTDRVAVMLFASRAKLTASLTTNRRTVTNALEDFWENVREVGSEGTVIGEGVYTAARYLRQKTEPAERRAIILITDDEDYGFGRPPQGLVLRELHAGNITLSAIVVNPRRKSRAGIAMSVSTAAMLAAINPISGAIMLGSALIFGNSKKPPSTSSFYSENTGGVTVNTKKEDVERMFVEMMAMLRTRYTFGYAMPEQSGQEDERRFREIKLNVTESARKQKGDMVVLARRGYFRNRKQQPESAALALVRRPPEMFERVASSNYPGVAAWLAQSRTELSASNELAEIEPSAPTEKTVAVGASFGLPELHIIKKATLAPKYGCNSSGDLAAGFQGSALFLSEYSRNRNIPDLLFAGSCDSPDIFRASTVEGDMALIADLGDVPIEEVSASQAFNSEKVYSPSGFYKFSIGVKADFNHTYAVLVSKNDIRGLFVFRVVGYIPNERADIVYAVKEYQILSVKGRADGFNWERKNSRSPEIKQ